MVFSVLKCGFSLIKYLHFYQINFPDFILKVPRNARFNCSALKSCVSCPVLLCYERGTSESSVVQVSFFDLYSFLLARSSLETLSTRPSACVERSDLSFFEVATLLIPRGALPPVPPFLVARPFDRLDPTPYHFVRFALSVISLGIYTIYGPSYSGRGVRGAEPPALSFAQGPFGPLFGTDRRRAVFSSYFKSKYYKTH